MLASRQGYVNLQSPTLQLSQQRRTGWQAEKYLCTLLKTLSRRGALRAIVLRPFDIPLGCLGIGHGADYWQRVGFSVEDKLVQRQQLWLRLV